MNYTTIVTLSFCMLIILTLSVSWIICKTYEKDNILVDFIFYIAVVKVFLYLLAPTILRTLSGYQYLIEDDVQLIDLVLLYGIEYLSWSIWALIFVLSMIYFKINLHNKSRYIYKIGNRLLVLLALLYCWSSLNRILLIHSIMDQTFKPLLHWVGFGIGPFMLLLSLYKKNITLFILGCLCTGFLLMLFSTRGTIFYTIIYILFIVYFYLRKVKYIIIVSILAFTVASTFIYTGIVPKLKITVDEYIPRVSVSINEIKHTGGRNVIEEIEWRFGANTRMSTAFIGLFERGEGAGIWPILNSSFGFMPRSLFPDKPHPSTVDGTNIYSQGMYTIYREIHGYQTQSMVEFSTGGHSFWEFGLIGVIVLGSISAIYMALCVKYFSKLGIASIPLMYAVFKPTGYVEPKMWVSDIVLQIYQIIIPLIFLILFLIFIDNTITHGRKYLRYFLKPDCTIRECDLQMVSLFIKCYDNLNIFKKG
jgi:hypothetical protein